MFDRTRIKFGESVWHDQDYLDSMSERKRHRDFYDRREASDEAYLALSGYASKAVILMGGRRSGKTSQIKYLKARFSSDALGRFGFVEIPWSGIRDRGELAREILQGVRAYIGLELGLKAVLANIPVADPATLGAFLEALHVLLALISDRRLILAIDEFDSILVASTRATGSTEEANRIVGLAHALVEDSSSNVRLLFSMAAIPDKLPDIRQSSLIIESTLIPLHPFPKPDMDTMVLDIVRDEHPMTDTDLDVIYELSGGWPYYAKLLLECMADVAPSPDQMQLAVQTAVRHEGATHTIADIYDIHLNDDQKKLVLLLATHNGQMTGPEMAVAGTAIHAAAMQLAGKDVVQTEPDGGCRFRIAFLAPWFPHWLRYELEVERRISDLLLRLERNGDHFLGDAP